MTGSRTLTLVLVLGACAAPPAHAADANTAVNGQVTDSVTQANVKVLGDAPAVAMGNLFVATSQALANAAHNATLAQQQANVTMQASTAQGVSLLAALDTDSTAAEMCQTYLTARLLATCLAAGS